VFIQKLRVERFGAIADLEIDGLTEGVTVIHGAAETGKSLLVDFVHALFFGFGDAQRTQHDAPAGSEFGGSIAIVDGRDACTLHRHDDGGLEGRLTLERHDGSTVLAHDVDRHLPGISPGLFDCVYAVDFARRPRISVLLHEAASSGFSLVDTDVDTRRRSQLRQSLDERRAELATLPDTGEPLETLRVRRATLLAEIGDLEARLAHLREEARRREERLPELEKQLRSARAELRTVGRKQETLKAQKVAALEQIEAVEQARAALRQLEMKLQDLDDRMERWNTVVNEVADRRETLHERPAAATLLPDGHGHPRHELLALENQLREFQEAVARRSRNDQHWHTTAVAKSVDDMQSRVHELRRELGWADAPAHHDCACEIQQLQRCETELSHAVGYLEVQRQELIARLGDRHQRESELARLEEQCRDIEVELARLERQHDEVVTAIDEAEIELELAHRRDTTEQREATDRLARGRAELDDVEQHYHAAERRRSLSAQISDLLRELERLEGTGEASIPDEASHYLRRLSAGDYCGVAVTSDRQVFVEDPAGLRRSWHELDSGARDQVYLSFCLALADALYRRGVDLPLVLHGTFTNYESRDVPEAAETIRDFAARGHQVLLLTRHEHVVSVSRLLNVSLRRLQVRGAGSGVGAIERSADGVHHLVTLLYRYRERDLEAAEATDRPGEWSSRTRSHESGRHQPKTSAYLLHEDDPVEAAPALDAENAARLRDLGINTIRRMMDMKPADGAAALRYGVTADRFESWQSQSMLMCRVPRLRPYDAQILVACGIRRPGQLERLGTGEVRAMIDRFAATSDGRAMLLSGTEYELSRITDWARSDELESADDHPWGGQRRDTHEPAAPSTQPPAGHRAGSHRNASHRQRSTQLESDVIKLRDDREPRFFLGLNDPIVAAPSIGPRSAEQLEAIGIHTVADFLDADPDEMADQLGTRRFSADTIEQWQMQSELVCRVPHLRGHDAQILVAVDVTEAEQLAQSDPHQLWERIAPFIDGAEGKRVIRNGKSPDLEEVCDWIRWARSARKLEEAA